MKINGNEIRPGNVIQHNGSLWAVAKLQHVKPGKGGAFAQVELKNLLNGSKLNALPLIRDSRACAAGAKGLSVSL